MKKVLVAIAALMITAAAYAQGQVNFSTKIGTDVDAPVLWGQNPAQGPGVNGAYKAELVLVAANGSLTPLTPTTVFRSNSDVASKYVVPLADAVNVPGTNPGDTVKIRFRAFNGASFDVTPASFRGQSGDLTVTLGGGTLPPANLNGLSGFTVPGVPEPSTIALGIIGLGALMIRRRK